MCNKPQPYTHTLPMRCSPVPMYVSPVSSVGSNMYVKAQISKVLCTSCHHLGTEAFVQCRKVRVDRAQPSFLLRRVEGRLLFSRLSEVATRSVLPGRIESDTLGNGRAVRNKEDSGMRE